MKKLFYLCSALLACLLVSCDDTYTEYVTYQVNEPVLMAAADFRASVKVVPESRDICQKGKICFYEGYLYISEPQKGIHIVDNRNPAHPKPVGFIELIGNADLAIRNNMLYADSYIDLLWFDISNPALPTLKNRMEGVFKYALPPTYNGYGYDFSACGDPGQLEKDVVVGWTVREKREKVERYKGDIYYEDMTANSPSGGSSSTGVNGSMSRFCMYQHYLYTVINDHLNIFDLSGDKPAQVGETLGIWSNVETVFNYKDCLFFGTPTGMVIYSVKDPLMPERQSALWHVYGCDPVVVENDIAYVTVHAGNTCGQNNNELIIIDVSDVKKPQPIVSYTMTQPKGLGIDKNTLFVCDEGLKIFDAKNPRTIMANKLAHYSGMDGYDVIPYNNVLMMIADDGIYQYDYSDLKGISQLSKLPITGK